MIKTRKKCVICDGDNLLDHYIFEKFPVYVGTTKENKEKHLLQDMHWAKCKKCNQIQLKKLIEEDILYTKPHNVALGKNWKIHHNTFVEFINKECYGNILEIGGGNLHIANKIAISEKIDKYEVLDSNIIKSNADTEKIIFNEKMFDLSLMEDEKYDFIIHSHVLEHFYEPLHDLKQIKRMLKPNGKMIFSAPMLDNMLKKGFTNSLNFEHTYYLSEKVVEYMIQKAGFLIEEKKFYSSTDLKDWCLFVKCSIGKKQISEMKYNKSLEDFQQFLDINKEAVVSLNKQLKEYNNYKKFIFGGHIFTQFLLNFGIDDDFICVLDNDEDKHGEFLYGTDLVVKSPQILSEYSQPVVVLRAGIYNNEIKKDILNNINDKTLFLE